MYILFTLFLLAVIFENENQTEYLIGYTTEYSNEQYNSRYFIDNYPVYNSPRKSPQRPYSGDWIEDLEDWSRMKGWGLLYDEDWPSYVNEDYWNEFLSEYPTYEEEAENWFWNHNQTPPWQTPIGDIPWIIIGVLILVYMFIYKK